MPDLSEREQKATCDRLLELAVESMHVAGAPLGMIVDRLLTYTLAQMCTVDGSPTTATNLRIMAGKVDEGAFHKLTGEDRQRHGLQH